MYTSALIPLSLSLLATSAIAIPFVSRASLETSPTDSSSNVLDSLVAQSAQESSNMNTCPLSHPSKQCCTSITAIANDITSEIGEFVPILKDVKLSTLINLECREMDVDESNGACLSDVMCCTGIGTGTSKTSLMKTCKPWDEAIDAKKKALDKSKKKQAGNNSTSSSATPMAASSTPKPMT